MTQRKLNWLVSAVAAVAVAGIGTSTFAQVRLDTGNVRDANNRIGSAGSNGVGASRVQQVNPNDIVYNNVTAGRGFHGRIDTTDGVSFHGVTGSELSGSFIRQSSGAPTGILSVNNAQQVRPFFDAPSRGVNPPPGYIQQGVTSGAYVPAPPETRAAGDLRIGAVQFDDTVIAPRPGETMLPGPVDASNSNSLITASPLFGVRQWNAGDDQALLNNSSLRGISDQSLDDQTLMQFRQQLEMPSTLNPNLSQQAQINNPNLTNPNQPGNEQNPNAAGAGTLDNNSAGQTSPNMAQPLPTPMGQAPSDALPSTQLPGENLAATNFGGGLRTNQMSTQRLLSAPTQQSTLYKQMDQQYRNFVGQQGLQQQQANREYNQALQNQRQQEAEANLKRATNLGGAPAPAQGNAPIPGGAGNIGGAEIGTGATGGNAPPPAAQGPINLGPTIQTHHKPAPVKVESLADGITASGLKQLMTKAEDEMHQGKWISAIETYNNAYRVAPNNPLIIVGRANAELGATYYARAEDDLKAAFTGDKKLLMGQYDLRKMVGSDRLEYVIGELKDMNQKDPKQTRPLFLLAYIAYNTGHEQQAAGYLDLIDQRDKGNELSKTLRQYWSLPGQENQATPSDMNK